MGWWDDFRSVWKGGEKKVRYFDFETDLDLIVASFYREYRINLLKDQISFKLYQVLLNNLSAESPLMKVVLLRSTPESELHDFKLKQLRRSLLLDESQEDSLKQFASLMRKE